MMSARSPEDRVFSGEDKDHFDKLDEEKKLDKEESLGEPAPNPGVKVSYCDVKPYKLSRGME